MRILPIVLLAIVSGCGLLYDGMCINERRMLSLDGTLEPIDTAVSASGTVSISIYEVRNHRTKQDRHFEHFSWSVRASGINPATVTAVHVHERDTNLLLFELPIENATALPDVITQRTGWNPTNAAIPWPDVYDLLGSGRGYLDVHIGGSQTPSMRSNLAAQHPNWQQFVHSSCS